MCESECVLTWPINEAAFPLSPPPSKTRLLMATCSQRITLQFGQTSINVS